MPRSRKSGAHSESYEVRWHSYADMTTPSVDIMSSPDPLNETSGEHVILPSSAIRRAPRSQRSSRFSARSSSPRKQTFELEVGDNTSPQRLLVTVETEEAGRNAQINGTRRRLFQSSSPMFPMRRGGTATTTTVPLRDTIEDELMTPRRRGRPRKTNGTPLPGAAAKRKAGTPIKRTPRRARTSEAGELENGNPASSTQATPRSGRRGRPPKIRTAEPSSDLGSARSRRSSSAAKRGRPRKSFDAGGLSNVVEEVVEEPEEVVDSIVVQTSPISSGGQSPVHAGNQSDDDGESDIWMATLDEEPASRVANRSFPSAHVSSPPQPRHQSPEPEQDFEPGSEPEPEPEPELVPEPEENEDILDEGDYGYLQPAASDHSSIDEPSSSARRPDDTIAQGEDFSMIFMDSIPSLATLRSSVFETTHDYFGEETSLIINNTLESLRQQTGQEEEEDDEQRTETAEPSLPVLPVPVVDDPEPLETRESRPALTFSPRQNRLRNLSPRWTQSPRRGAFSPLRQQVLKSQAKQTDDTPRTIAENDRSEIQSSTRRPRFDKPTRGSGEESNLYDDSFSEIPQNVLEAATPRRPNVQLEVEDDEEEAEELEEQQVDEIEDHEAHQNPEEQNPPLTASNASVVSAGRLPTPDDTPPHVDAEVGQDQEKLTQVSESSPLAAPTPHSRSAPEIMEEIIEEEEEIIEVDDDLVDEVDDLLEEEEEEENVEMEEEIIEEEENGLGQVEEQEGHIEGSLAEISTSRQLFSLPDERPPQVEETPINQMTSPLQEPQSVVPETLQEKLTRPALSPIVRAGRALQSVTSDPPSPEPRENQLRSPFRGSATKDPGPAGRGTSYSPRRPGTYPDVTQLPAAGEVYDDPFGTDTRHTGQLSFMEALSRSSTTAGPKRHISSRGSTASSMRITPPSEDEMSWVANEGPISANLRGDVSLGEIARAAGVNGVNNTTQTPSNAIAPTAEVVQEEQDDEPDIWEIEAQRETPRSTRQRPFGKKVTISAGRRRALPSPWMRQRMQRRESPIEAPQTREEEQVDDDMTEDAAPEAVEGEEYSLLAQGQNIQPAKPIPDSAKNAGRFDLSSFFSSPALIPGRVAGPDARTTESQVRQEAAVLPTSSLFPQIPQNRDSVPKPRQPGPAVFQGTAQAGGPTPPRMQLSHADIRRWQQETSSAGEVPAQAHRALLRPLPPKNASPAKSSLRSPLKPHTPGRVVEFTSSVLSPVEQAKIRHQRRLSQSSASAPPSAIRPAPTTTFMARLGNFPQLRPTQTIDQEDNAVTDATISDATTEAQSFEPEPLSRTKWTRQHWQFLDLLLRMRRAGPFDLAYERTSERFLGKTIISRGETMTLEKWHLDCVDAFKAEVGGWDERGLVMRFVGLLLGEARRGRGVVDTPRRAMFH